MIHNLFLQCHKKGYIIHIYFSYVTNSREPAYVCFSSTVVSLELDMLLYEAWEGASKYLHSNLRMKHKLKESSICLFLIYSCSARAGHAPVRSVGGRLEVLTVEASNETKLNPETSSVEVTANVRESEIVAIELGTSK